MHHTLLDTFAEQYYTRNIEDLGMVFLFHTHPYYQHKLWRTTKEHMIEQRGKAATTHKPNQNRNDDTNTLGKKQHSKQAVTNSMTARASELGNTMYS